MWKRLSAVGVLVLVLGGCGGAVTKHGSTARRVSARRPSAAAAPRRAPARRAASRAAAVALVTAETRNELLAVDVASGRIRARVSLPADPEYVAVGARIVVVSNRGRTVTLLAPQSLRIVAQIGGFLTPQVVAVSPGGEFAYVTDDAAGTVTPIDLRTGRRYPALAVGAGAHHMTFSPDGRRLWVALGESARSLVLLNTAQLAHPRVLRRFAPGFAVHDLAFSLGGDQLWLTAATGPDVTVVSARTLRPLFTVPVGPPPQHIAMTGDGIYLTSGYAGRIEDVAGGDGRVLAVGRAPYGSFELDAGNGRVVTASLLGGMVTAFSSATLRPEWMKRIPPATRDVSLAPGAEGP